MPDAMTPEKAKQILRDGEVNGQPLTEAQRGMFGVIAGGGTPTKLHQSREGSHLRIPMGAERDIVDEAEKERKNRWR